MFLHGQGDSGWPGLGLPRQSHCLQECSPACANQEGASEIHPPPLKAGKVPPSCSHPSLLCAVPKGRSHSPCLMSFLGPLPPTSEPGHVRLLEELCHPCCQHQRGADPHHSLGSADGWTAGTLLGAVHTSPCGLCTFAHHLHPLPMDQLKNHKLGGLE